ncbi:DUF6415 family natural product biosynthesis protein [Streptomyces sp. Isolate_219]|uniref:DUF6415 family natural product biosynthesis protein n=1 Tax=Streptomyces sp. Isolate_219 TaxID=2950110 RepID=UPI0021C9E1C9|nr:DUF6415 family natural product biosynthesis protein [Streptomyces sp. Isolate_219]MCR8573435.1 DUF6415 family natural product biosynthesis protein [Streptomyces sp. Isolate_219]
MDGTDATLDGPIDSDTIGETIHRALRIGSGRPDFEELGALENDLCGHIALLLPEAREAAARLWHGSIEAHRLTARLDGIEWQTTQGLGHGPLSAHVQVHQLARDCQYLLARHTAAARP